MGQEEETKLNNIPLSVFKICSVLNDTGMIFLHTVL